MGRGANYNGLGTRDSGQGEWRGATPRCIACGLHTVYPQGGDTKQGHGTRDKGLGTRDMRQMMRRELPWSVPCAA